MIQIIKQILILHKDNPNKYKKQFWNKKAVQTCLALREK